MNISEISVQQLAKMQKDKQDFLLLDVREQNEYDFCKLENSTHIPLGTIPGAKDSLTLPATTVVYCRSGARSAQAAAILQQQNPSATIYNLTGGILAWSREIDPSIPQY